MDQSHLARYRRWFDYEKDSHAKVLASLRSVPSAGQSSPPFTRAVSLMCHLVAARQLWLYRFGVAREGPGPNDFFPEGVALADLEGRLERVHAAWSAYLNTLNDSDLARQFEYQSLDGKRFRNTVEDILGQLFGHSWYHRGQIAMLVRQAGGEPAATDFVYWTREAIPDPSR
jgi:uncharacterized damage-inducible protein DinB